MDGPDLLSPAGQLLVLLARDADMRIVDLAAATGLSERRVQQVLGALVEADLVRRTRLGRRNRYEVSFEAALPDLVSGGHRVGDVLGALSGTDEADGPVSLVVACNDYRFPCSDERYQRQIARILASEGISASSEIIAASGGSAALGGDDGPALIAAMGRALGRRQADRIILTAHQGCRVPGASLAPGEDPAVTNRRIAGRRRRGIELVREAFGVEPEVWFVSTDRTLHVHAPTKLPTAGVGA